MMSTASRKILRVVIMVAVLAGGLGAVRDARADTAPSMSTPRAHASVPPSSGPGNVKLAGQATQAQAAAVEALDPLPTQPNLFVRRVIDVEGTSLAVAQDIATLGVTATITLMTARLTDPTSTVFTLTPAWSTTVTPSIKCGNTDAGCVVCDGGCEGAWTARTDGAEVCAETGEFYPVCWGAAWLLGNWICDSACSSGYTPGAPPAQPSCYTSSSLQFYSSGYGQDGDSYDHITCFTGDPAETLLEADLYAYSVCNSGCSSGGGGYQWQGACLWSNNVSQQAQQGGSASCNQSLYYYCGATSCSGCQTEYDQWAVQYEYPYPPNNPSYYTIYVYAQSNEACH